MHKLLLISDASVTMQLVFSYVEIGELVQQVDDIQMGA